MVRERVLGDLYLSPTLYPHGTGRPSVNPRGLGQVIRGRDSVGDLRCLSVWWVGTFIGVPGSGYRDGTLRLRVPTSLSTPDMCESFPSVVGGPRWTGRSSVPSLT